MILSTSRGHRRSKKNIAFSPRRHDQAPLFAYKVIEKSNTKNTFFPSHPTSSRLLHGFVARLTKASVAIHR